MSRKPSFLLPLFLGAPSFSYSGPILFSNLPLFPLGIPAPPLLPSTPFLLSSGPNKDDIRAQIWTLMEESNLADFPRPCHQRIPNFRGSRNACEKLLGLDCFRKAVTIKVNPDKPQETARFLTLQFNKKVSVPVDMLLGFFSRN